MIPLVVGVAGGSGSGKSTVVRRLVRRLGSERVSLVSVDWYYRDGGHLSPDDRAHRNYDHPDSIDDELLIQHVSHLKGGSPIEAPQYDFRTHLRETATRRVNPRQCVIVDGILALAVPELRPLLDLKLFVDTDADLRLIRRLARDVRDRGRTVESVLRQWEATVRPMYLEFVEPSRRYADLIIPEGGHNQCALDVIVARLLLDPSSAAK